MLYQGGAKKVEQLESTLEKVIEERDDLRQELIEPYAMCTRLAKMEQTIKILKLESAKQSGHVEYNDRFANKYKQYLNDFAKCHANHGF